MCVCVRVCVCVCGGKGKGKGKGKGGGPSAQSKKCHPLQYTEYIHYAQYSVHTIYIRTARCNGIDSACHVVRVLQTVLLEGEIQRLRCKLDYVVPISEGNRGEDSSEGRCEKVLLQVQIIMCIIIIISIIHLRCILKQLLF